MPPPFHEENETPRGKVRALMRFANGKVREGNVDDDESSLVSRGHEAFLHWDAPPKRVLVVRSPYSHRAGPAEIRKVAAACLGLGLEVYATGDEEALFEDADTPVVRYNRDSMRRTIDAVICMGGDGLLLYVCSELFINRVPPILAFNMGSLGFLTPFDFNDHDEHLRNLLSLGRHAVSLRQRLACTVHRSSSTDDNALMRRGSRRYRAGEICEAQTPGTETFNVLNELVIDRGPAPYLGKLECFCDEVFVTQIQADGVIVATPTGSTAYSLSSGGSMVHPAVSCIALTPICPHSLSFRPVLFPDYVTLTIRVPEDARCSAWVSFDGRNRLELDRGDFVTVQLSRHPVATFCHSSQTNDWFQSARRCLGWNERLAQNPMPHIPEVDLAAHRASSIGSLSSGLNQSVNLADADLPKSEANGSTEDTDGS